MNTIVFVFIDGQLKAELSDCERIPHSVEFSCENNKLLVRIAKNATIPAILHFKYLNGCAGLQRTWEVGENSIVSVIEEYASDHENSYSTHTKLDVQLHKFASMKYHKIQNENQHASHQGWIQVEQKESSNMNMFFADCGGNNSRSETKISLSEKDATCYMHGIYFLNHDQQSIANDIHVDHAAELGTSSMVFKGVLDKKSKAQFQGSVHVHEKARRTNAHQENHNLLLSAMAEVASKPQLEIYADDVKCTHGATVGQLDQDSLFYLRSRGIDEDAALKILTNAFLAEIMENVEDPLIRTYIRERVAQHEVF